MKRKPLNVVSILHGLTKLLARNDVGSDIRRELEIHPKTWDRFLDDYDKEPVNTVNVIETVDGTVVGMKSWLDSFAGNYSAEAHFRHLVKEHNKEDGPKFSDEDFSSMMNDGTYDDDCGYRLFITHSV